MSYILDALRKSQQARQPGSAPGPRGAVHNISLSLPGGGWWLAAGIVLLLGMVAAALIFWHGTVESIPAAPLEAAPAAPAINPASGRNEKAPAENPANSAISTTSPVTEKAPLPVETPAKSTAAVRDLAEEAQVPARVTRKKASTARPRSKAVVSRRSAASGSVPALPLVQDDTPLLQQMPVEFQRALPSMAVTIHVYSHEESQRILFVNNREFHKGDQIESGIRVEEIVPDGAVLSYRGERFKLGRPR